jgi:hypothetical protein
VSAEGLAAFAAVVVTDPDLQDVLLAAPDRHWFVALVVERARAGGWDVDPEDVEDGLSASRRAWRQRWI